MDVWIVAEVGPAGIGRAEAPQRIARAVHRVIRARRAFDGAQPFSGDDRRVELKLRDIVVAGVGRQSDDRVAVEPGHLGVGDGAHLELILNVEIRIAGLQGGVPPPDLTGLEAPVHIRMDDSGDRRPVRHPFRAHRVLPLGPRPVPPVPFVVVPEGVADDGAGQEERIRGRQTPARVVVGRRVVERPPPPDRPVPVRPGRRDDLAVRIVGIDPQRRDDGDHRVIVHIEMDVHRLRQLARHRIECDPSRRLGISSGGRRPEVSEAAHDRHQQQRHNHPEEADRDDDLDQSKALPCTGECGPLCLAFSAAHLYCCSPIEVPMGEQLPPVPTCVCDEFRPCFLGRNSLDRCSRQIRIHDNLVPRLTQAGHGPRRRRLAQCPD